MNDSNVKKSRVFKSSRNAIFSVINQVLSLIAQFVVRTVFIRTLATEYLGLNGLFSNVLSVLSLAELGLGTAIVCSMYGPLARKDEKEILKFFNAYRLIYAIIGGAIGVIGLCLLPFIRFFVQDSSGIPLLELYFGMYLIDTVSSYFFAHYKSLYSADQKDYINTIIKLVVLIIQTSAQILILLLTHNFIFYLIAKIACNLLSGLISCIKSKKDYPFLSDKTKTRLTKEDKKSLFSDSFGVLSSRIGLVVLNSTDSILISSFFGSVITGIYSNYYLIIGAVSTTVNLVFSAVEASIGDYCVQNDKNNANSVFLNIHYVFYCLYGFSSICLVSLLTPFVNSWLGTDFVLGKEIVIIVCINFFLSCSRQANLSFITVNHLSKKVIVKNVVEPIINLVVSIILAKCIGLIGVFIGTTVSLVLTSIWFEPFVLYKYYFEKGYSKYCILFIYRFVFALAGAALCFFLANTIYDGTILRLLLCFAISILSAIAFVTIPFIKTRPFNYLLSTMKKFMRLVFKNRKKDLQNEEL